MEKERAEGWEEDQESGVMKASGGKHGCWAWDLGDLDGGFSIICKGLGASLFSSLDLSFPHVTPEKLALVS